MTRHIFLTDHKRVPDWRTACARLQIGDRVILRDYDAPDRTDRAYEIARFAKTHRLEFSLAIATANDARLATRLGADLHLPRFARLPRAALKARHISIGASNLRELYKAAALGVDSVLIAPVFATQTHPHTRPLGIIRLAILARRARALGLQPYALGGMSAAHYRRCRAIPLDGFAAIGAFALYFSA